VRGEVSFGAPPLLSGVMRRQPALLALLLAIPEAGTASVAPDTPAPPRADRSRGLWIGPIHLCRDTVEGAVAGVADRGPYPTLTITLRADLRPELQRETGRLVGSAMPVRLDGKLISEPIVLEPLTAGVLALAGQSEEETEAMQAAVGEPC